MSTLLDILHGPWAIMPQRLLEIQALYEAHTRGEKIDVKGIEARIGQRLAPEQQAYQVQEGTVGVLTLEGVIAPKANLMMQICGGISAQMTIQQLDAMAADPRLKSAALAIDSPGGSVQMVPAVADAVRRLAAAKPTVAVSQGTMASALYWIGGAANAIMLSGPTDMVGSIGVVATHTYTPRQAGTVTTEIVAGQYKRAASPSKPLDKQGAAYLQAQVDEIYRVFVETIAADRGVAAADVMHYMADGRIFVGQQAIDRGLADGFATLDQVVMQLASDPNAYAKRRKAKFATRIPGPSAGAPSPKPAGVAGSGHSAAGSPVPAAANPQPVETQTTMNPEQLAAFAAEHPEAAAALRAEGATAERARIQGVQGAAMPGTEALVAALAFDGKTTPGDAAIAVLGEVRKQQAAASSAHFDDAPNAAPAAAAPTQGAGQELTKEEQRDKAKAYAAEKGCDFLTAFKALGYTA